MDHYFPPEDENIPLWRYVDLTKLVDLLEHQALFLPKVSRFKDPFEGTVALATIQAAKAGRPPTMIELGGRERPMTKEEFANLLELAREARDLVCASCWHMSEFESAAFWEQYGRGVAIRSTYRRLVDSLPKGQRDVVRLGIVRYIDFERHLMPPGDVLAISLYKRLSFEHEKELRLLTAVGEPTTPGFAIPVDVSTLVEEVVVSPFAEEWEAHAVRAICRRYEAEFEVQRSKLFELPGTEPV